jgi:hypothetical protein
MVGFIPSCYKREFYQLQNKVKILELVSAANLSLFTTEQEANISAIASELLQEIYA